MSTQATIGKCSVWIYGSELSKAGWIEDRVIEVGEGFSNQREAKAWAAQAMVRLKTETTRPERYKIGPAF